MAIRRRVANSSQTPFAVIDLETTGFGNDHRIVEISIITLDFETLDTLEEYDTLVNPERDISDEVTKIHHLTASILEAAPTFNEIAPAVARRLNGAYLVAHNKGFDVPFLQRAFDKINGALHSGTPLCTMQLSRKRKLETACSDYDIELEQAHRALTDARACAGLLRKLVNLQRVHIDHAVARCIAPFGDVIVRTLRRENTELGGAIRRIGKSPWQDPERDYRYAVNLALDDGVISDIEKSELKTLRKSLGLSEKEATKQREILFERSVAAVKRDQHISKVERAMLERMGTSLEIDFDLPDDEVQTTELKTGMAVCFTGSGQGMRSKEEMNEIAESKGLTVKSGISSHVDVLIAADVASTSGKTRRARELNIPVMSATDFLSLVIDI